jgi:DNA-binding NarL/FixJ family response regulator
MQQPQPKFRVVLADNDPQIRRLVVNVLGDHFELLAAVGGGQDAVEATRQFKPDIVILDFAMPDLNGLNTVRCLVASSLMAKIVIITNLDDTGSILTTLAAGVHGFVLAHRICEDLLHAIREVLAGRTFVSQWDL